MTWISWLMIQKLRIYPVIDSNTSRSLLSPSLRLPIPYCRMHSELIEYRTFSRQIAKKYSANKAILIRKAVSNLVVFETTRIVFIVVIVFAGASMLRYKMPGLMR